MSKVAEFLNKVAVDEAAKAEFDAVIGVRKERELSEEELTEVVAGGSGGVFAINPKHWCWKCPYCGRMYDAEKRYVPSESEMKEETMNQIICHFLMHKCYYFQNEYGISYEWARQKAEEIINMEYDPGTDFEY